MRTRKTCCCCGDNPCVGMDGEYRYGGGEANCPICALGTTTTNILAYEQFAPYEPSPNQGDDPWSGADADGDGWPNLLHFGELCWHPGEEGWIPYAEGCDEDWNPCWTNYRKYFEEYYSEETRNIVTKLYKDDIMLYKETQNA